MSIVFQMIGIECCSLRHANKVGPCIVAREEIVHEQILSPPPEAFVQPDVVPPGLSPGFIVAGS